MAKPRKKQNGSRTLIVQHKGLRRQLTLGKITARQANYFAAKVDKLVDFAKHGGAVMPADLQSWLETISESHKRQLGSLGLFEYYLADITVAQLLEIYLADYKLRTEVRDSTKRKIESSIRNRFNRIGHRRLSEIEPRKRSIRVNAIPVHSESARKILTDFNAWQRNFLAVATWSRDNKLLRTVGRFAVERGICDFNPFDLPVGSMINSSRNVNISAAAVLDAMDACLEQDTRLTLALGRFAGFRVPSEVRTLKWEWVDFDRDQLVILDSKKLCLRVMPLFDRIRSELERQQKITGGERFVASEVLRSNSDSRNYNRILAAIRRSGQRPWDKLRQNLRSSCENELLEIFQEHLVTSWLGHTVQVSRDHYQKQRDSTYKSAVSRARQLNLE